MPVPNPTRASLHCASAAASSLSRRAGCVTPRVIYLGNLALEVQGTMLTQITQLADGRAKRRLQKNSPDSCSRGLLFYRLSGKIRSRSILLKPTPSITKGNLLPLEILQVPSSDRFGGITEYLETLSTLFFSFKDMRSDLFFSGWTSYRKECNVASGSQGPLPYPPEVELEGQASAGASQLHACLRS